MAICGPITKPPEIPADHPAYIRMLISAYFTEDQWENAWCIVDKECPPSLTVYPGFCIKQEGIIQCNPDMPPASARAWGVFGLLDICWDPAMNSKSPFTSEQWSRVMDPNYNTWMASKIWSNFGWDAWSTAPLCNLQGIPGGPVPMPNGPNPALSVYNPPNLCTPTTNWTLVVGAAAVGLALLLTIASEGR